MPIRLALAFILAICVALVAVSGTAAAGENPLPKLKKDLERGLQAADKALLVKTVEEIGKCGDLEAMKVLLQVALKADDIEKLPPDAANDLYEAVRAALASMKDKQAEEYLFKNVKSHKDARARVVLTEVIAAKEGAPAEDALLDLMDDKRPEVAGTAIKGLAKRECVRAIEPMIALLGKVEKQRQDPWLDLVRGLTFMTGEDFPSALEWKSWWDGNKTTFDPKKKKGKKTEPVSTVTRETPKLFGTEVLSQRIVFILDVSGSMAIKDPISEGGKRGKAVDPKDPGYGEVPLERMRMWRLKNEMVKCIEQLPENTRFSIVTFGTGAKKWHDELIPASAKNKADAIDFANSMNPEGFTWTDTAVELAFEIEDANAFYLFSDGIPQRGKKPTGEPDHIDRQEILEKIQQWNRTRKVKIYTIGLGEADARFMAQIAEQNDGKFVAVP